MNHLGALYHVHLAHLENVVATAIGRFCIRQEDADAQQAAQGVRAPVGRARKVVW